MEAARVDRSVTKLPDPVVEEIVSAKNISERTTRYAINKVLLSIFAAEPQRRLNGSNEFGGISVVLLGSGTFISGMIDGRSPKQHDQVEEWGHDPFRCTE